MRLSRPSLALALAATALAAGGSAAAGPAAPGVEAEIARLETAAVQAKTLEELQRLYAPDVVDFTPSHMMTGFAKLAANMGVIVPQVTDWQVSIVPGTESVIATDDMAVASNLQVWRSSYKDTGALAMEMVYRQTDVWRRQPDGAWRIVHAHSSIPVDPLTERPLCLHADGECPIPNFPRRGLDAVGVAKLNATYGDVFAKIPPPKAKPAAH